MEKSKVEDYYDQMGDYLSRPFFKKDDRKVCFLLGKYYEYLSNKEKTKLKTTSLYTKLPSYLRRLDKDQVYKILDKCNSVVNRLIAKNKGQTETLSNVREQLNDLLSKDNWESSHYELSLAFMMGFTFHVRSEKEDENQEIDNEE